MKMYLISDNIDTLVGLRLAGVEGVLAHDRKHLQDALSAALEDKELAVLLLTEKFSRDYPDLINAVKLNTGLPLIIEIPDRHGSGRKKDFITAYVNEAIGLKL